MRTILSLLTLILTLFTVSSLALASPAEDWGPPTTTTNNQWGPWGHHQPTTATTTDWVPTTAWVPTTTWIAPPEPTTWPTSDSWSEYTSYSLTTITVSFTTCPNGCFESTTLSTFSVPVSTFEVDGDTTTWLGAAPSTTSWSLTLPTTTNGWTLLPPTGVTTYGTGSVVTYVSGSSTSLSTIGAISYTSYTSYSVETFISGTSTSLSTIGLPTATPIIVSGADREVQSGWSLGAAMVGAAGAMFALL